jgi:predicted transcriptional regulator
MAATWSLLAELATRISVSYFAKGAPVSTDILISLHPQHSANILAGRKTVELRRRPVRVSAGTRIWMYAKHPKSCIEGLAVVDRVCEAPLDELWAEFGDQVGISKQDFDQYMKGMVIGCAIVLRSAEPLQRSIPLGEMRRRVKKFHPPQFFKRLAPACEELTVLSQQDEQANGQPAPFHKSPAVGV